MDTFRVAPGAFSAPAALRSAAWVGGIGITLSATAALTGWGLPCPWRELTGTLCPFCGATTMGRHLLGGDLAAAWEANALVLVAVALLGLACVAWAVEAAGGPALRPPGRLRRSRVWGWAAVAALAIFGVLRNLG